MRVQIPQSDLYSRVRLYVKTPAGEFQVDVDDSHKTYDVRVDATHEAVTEIVAVFLGNDGQPVETTILVKEAEHGVEPKQDPEKLEEVPVQEVPGEVVEEVCVDAHDVDAQLDAPQDAEVHDVEVPAAKPKRSAYSRGK